ncbi:MAG: helix-turn-helix domain-containing protein [Gallionella sp.]|nr:helix-turn-helix domain-containing protein [Gallionella sp.]
MRINQADTAREVFHTTDFQPQQQRILDLINRLGGDWTIGEIAASTGLDKSAVSGRRNSLLAIGAVELGHERKCSRSGKTCQTIRLPVGQMDLLAA